MEFTKEELYEIEKFFDYQAATTREQMGRLLNSVSNLPDSKGKEKLMGSILESCSRSYDVCRTISTKCEMLRRGDNDGKKKDS